MFFIKPEVLFIASTFLLFGCGRELFYSDKKTVFGTYAEVKVWGSDSAELKSAVEDAFKEMYRVQDVFSVYSKESQVYALNEQKKTRVSDEVIYLLKRSIEFSQLTDGAFDVTIYPLMKVWKEIRNKIKKTDVSEEEINMKVKSVLSKVSYKNINFLDGNVVFLDGLSEVDFGGIAVGYAIDRVIDMLKERGIKKAVVNVGGDIYGYGKKFRIGLQHPRKEHGVILAVFDVENEAVSTSGDYQKYFIFKNKRYHHILNPKTGFPAEGLISVTVFSKTAIEADALATAVMVLGYDKGKELLKKLKLDYILIDQDGRISHSKGIEGRKIQFNRNYIKIRNGKKILDGKILP